MNKKGKQTYYWGGYYKSESFSVVQLQLSDPFWKKKKEDQGVISVSHVTFHNMI